MLGGDQGERNAGTPAGARTARGPERRNRGAAALIDAVFPETPARAAAPQATHPQGLLAGAVSELARRTGAETACAWLASKEQGFTRVAAYTRSGQPVDDDLEPGAFEALRRLARATDLGESQGEPISGRVSDASGITAAVALGRQGGGEFDPGLAVLGLGAPEDALGAVRPRTLAVLQEVAQQIDGPLATLAALEEIRRLGEEVRWLDRQAVLGEMVGEVVHEIRNPLVSVKTFLDLLPENLDDADFIGDFRTVVRGEVGRLERLLDAVLQHAQPERLGDSDGDADVAAAIDTLAGLLAHRAGEKEIRLACHADPAATRVAVTPDSLQQVLLNLALNALGATPAGGEVRVNAYAPTIGKGHWVEFTVEDTGPGIPAAERERIFEAFANKRSGRPGGLGLAITRRLVEEAGGSIEAADASGGGARMVVRLPGSGKAAQP